MELPIITFIQQRLAETSPNFETRQGSAHYDLFVIPQQFMLQPLTDYMSTRRVGQSVRQILALASPDSFDTTAVDDLAANLYVERDSGAIATTTVRVSYITPKAVEFPALTAQFTSNSLNFFNKEDVTVTAAEMALQSDGSLYYIDILVQAEAAGSEYNVDIGAITAILNDADAVRVTNLYKAEGGLTAETNTQLLTRVHDSIGVRDLETGKGINAILKENFPILREIMSIGMGDPEMQRDILYNIHTGSRTDVYLKTPSLAIATTDFNGLIVDTTRQTPRSSHLEMARNANDSLLPAFTGTTNIVPASVVVKEDVVETVAIARSIAIPTIGIDLTGKEWLNFTIDTNTYQVKVSGTNIALTLRSEIVSAINNAVGSNVAQSGPGGTFVISSPTYGSNSLVSINVTDSPIASSNNAAVPLFDVALIDLPISYFGIGANVYVEGVDYVVEYLDGKIYQTSFDGPTRDPGSTGRQTITSGQTMVSVPQGAPTGKFTLVGSEYVLDDSTSGAFYSQPLVNVRTGDQVTITGVNGSFAGVVNGIAVPSTYTVAEATSDQRLRLSDFAPTGATAANTVSYTIVSNQSVVVSYKYNPVSIDIGDQILLADGRTRGARPGRGAYTITNTPFIKILSIQEIDPDTQELIGDPLLESRGFGAGGFGTGGYGIGVTGDYSFFVNAPPQRFSVQEDSVILFTSDAISRSYRVTYYWSPEIKAVHDFTRSDSERVTGADVLVKNYIPCFVDIAIGIRRDPTNISTPANDALATLVGDLVNSTTATSGLTATSIETLLHDQGVKSVQTPFDMVGHVYNPDGSTLLLDSQDVLKIPTVTLASQTDNYTTPRITHFYPGTITVTEVS